MNDGSLLLAIPDELLDLISGFLVLLLQLLLVVAKLAHPALDVNDRLIVFCDSVHIRTVLDNRFGVLVGLRGLRGLVSFHTIAHLKFDL